nr:immunoglobulin heavy chain junction region [Mus musculus]MBK4197996.1 immunoglobulin heavy chain junction region [Mus musculus]MBK4197998.1 immunoglobulin heavy chain junction region [Mus musculus]
CTRSGGSSPPYVMDYW